MSLVNSTSIRLSAEKQHFYEIEATAKNLPLRTYLRQRLEREDTILEEIISLRQVIREANTREEQNTDAGMMVEILLLLRQLAQPRQVNLAQSELKRLGLTVWSSSNAENKP